MPNFGSKNPKPSCFDDVVVTNKSRSVVHENRMQSVLDSYTTPNSGALPNISQKGDLQDGLFVWQAKLTKNNHFKITEPVVTEVCRQASLNSKWPAMVLTLEGLPDQIEKDWVVLPANVFKELLTTYKSK